MYYLAIFCDRPRRICIVTWPTHREAGGRGLMSGHWPEAQTSMSFGPISRPDKAGATLVGSCPGTRWHSVPPPLPPPHGLAKFCRELQQSLCLVPLYQEKTQHRNRGCRAGKDDITKLAPSLASPTSTHTPPIPPAGGGVKGDAKKWGKFGCAGGGEGAAPRTPPKQQSKSHIQI